MLPNVENLELALLGGLVMNNKLIKKTTIIKEMFFNKDYSRIFSFIMSVNDIGKSIDMMLLKNKLYKSGILDRLGGDDFIDRLFGNYVSETHFNDYEYKIKKAYKQRLLIVSRDKLKRIATEGSDLDNGVNEVYENINNILSDVSNKDNISVDKGVDIMLDEIEQNKGKELIGFSWGNDFLDKATRGIRKSKTYRIGAPSGVGKTNLLYQTTSNLLQQGARVMVASLENSISSTYMKLLSSMQGVSPNGIENGSIKPEVDFIKDFKDSLLITDQIFDIDEIFREILKFKPDVVFLDYIGLVDIKNCDERTLYNKYADLQKKFVQRNQDIAWIDLSNLNKDDDEDRIRQHLGFNGSAKLRNNTDVGIHMFYYKPFYEYRKETLRIGESDSKGYNDVLNKQVITFLISKNRLGPANIEEQFYIDFDKGIRYNKATDKMKESWNIL